MKKTLPIPVRSAKEAHACGPLCPEHGDPRDTNVTPSQSRYAVPQSHDLTWEGPNDGLSS